LFILRKEDKTDPSEEQRINFTTTKPQSQQPAKLTIVDGWYHQPPQLHEVGRAVKCFPKRLRGVKKK
jgi:hypothetical protein